MFFRAFDWILSSFRKVLLFVPKIKTSNHFKLLRKNKKLFDRPTKIFDCLKILNSIQKKIILFQKLNNFHEKIPLVSVVQGPFQDLPLRKNNLKKFGQISSETLPCAISLSIWNRWTKTIQIYYFYRATQRSPKTTNYVSSIEVSTANFSWEVIGNIFFNLISLHLKLDKRKMLKTTNKKIFFKIETYFLPILPAGRHPSRSYSTVFKLKNVFAFFWSFIPGSRKLSKLPIFMSFLHL